MSSKSLFTPRSPLPARLARCPEHRRRSEVAIPNLAQDGGPAHERAFGIIGGGGMQGARERHFRHFPAAPEPHPAAAPAGAFFIVHGPRKDTRVPSPTAGGIDGRLQAKGSVEPPLGEPRGQPPPQGNAPGRTYNA